MEELGRLRETLEESLRKNGDKPLTISHLINIIKFIEKQVEKEESWSDNHWDNDWN